MSQNKILALIGAILYSFTPFFFLLLTLGVGNIASYYDSTMTMDDSVGFGILTGIMIFFFVASLVLCVLNWVAFAKLDGAKEKGWRVYLLVSGIIICVFQVWFWLIGAAPGVLFILAYALNRNKAQNPVQEVTSEAAWTEVSSPAPTPVTEIKPSNENPVNETNQDQESGN